MIAVIENFSVSPSVDPTVPSGRQYVLEAIPLGIIRNGIFERGGDSFVIPPNKVTPASFDDINTIYAEAIPKKERFCFSSLSSNPDILVPINGNSFFLQAYCNNRLDRFGKIPYCGETDTICSCSAF